jgi:hypothetical protein
LEELASFSGTAFLIDISMKTIHPRKWFHREQKNEGRTKLQFPAFILYFQMGLSDFSPPFQGCQVFLDTMYQNGGKSTKWPQTIPKQPSIIPKGHKLVM